LAKTVNRNPELLKTVRYDRALAYVADGQSRKARADLEKIVAADPEYLDARQRLEALS
jgi:Tfp pilus assembly protein PilF